MACISILRKLIKIDFEMLEAPYLQASMFGATGTAGAAAGCEGRIQGVRHSAWIQRATGIRDA
jgi:hypothetical protein